MSQHKKERAIFTMTSFFAGMITVFAIMTLARGIYEYNQYPKYKRYPFRLMTVEETYPSFWDYLQGHKQVIYRHDGHVDTSKVNEGGFLQPMYDNPNL